jgi:hypothetical protein
MGQRFRLLTVARYDLSGAFNVSRMNGYAPFISFDPGADGVPYAPVRGLQIGTPMFSSRKQLRNASARGLRASYTPRYETDILRNRKTDLKDNTGPSAIASDRPSHLIWVEWRQ